MRLINETKNVGPNVYERAIGCTLNLHELIESAENSEIPIGNGPQVFYVNTVEYEVFVSGKPVDARKITISLYDTEDVISEYWQCEAVGDQVETEEVNRLISLEKMSKEELIEMIRDLS